MDSTLACLAAWMPRQRWYAAKGRRPSLRLISWWDLRSDEADVRIRTFLVADEGTLPPVLYQVPVVARATATISSANGHVIGSPEPGTTFIDGPHDPAYSAALLQLLLHGGTAPGPRGSATGHPLPGAADHHVRTAHVLTGEQSNTSVIYLPVAEGAPIIAKVFRQLHPGMNPDIELQSALTAAASPHVPASLGSLEGEWPDIASRDVVAGSLAFAQEYFTGVEDAWRVALRSAAAGDDFSVEARALGASTAAVHRSLATLFPTRDTAPADHDATAETWRRRLAIAIAEVPAISERREAIESVYRRAFATDWPALQRIHGDYHLGQVLQTPQRGWVLLDFEGEPLRPMRERVQPDLALRDVAGMLRSFDYVAGSIRLDQPHRSPEAVRGWAGAARAAFLDGYARESDTDLAALSPLLAALELDKAVYEAIYEARNRPTWVTIPLRAIARLTDRTAPVR